METGKPPRRPTLLDVLRGRSRMDYLYTRSKSAAYAHVGLSFLVGIMFLVLSIGFAVSAFDFASSSHRAIVTVEEIHSDLRSPWCLVRLPQGTTGRLEVFDSTVRVGETMSVYLDDATPPAIELSQWPGLFDWLIVLLGPMILTFAFSDARQLQAFKRSIAARQADLRASSGVT